MRFPFLVLWVLASAIAASFEGSAVASAAPPFEAQPPLARPRAADTAPVTRKAGLVSAPAEIAAGETAPKTLPVSLTVLNAPPAAQTPSLTPSLETSTPSVTAPVLMAAEDSADKTEERPAAIATDSAAAEPAHRLAPPLPDDVLAPAIETADDRLETTLSDAPSVSSVPSDSVRSDFFVPYLPRIQQTLPPGWVMRLPDADALHQILALDRHAYFVDIMSATLPAQFRLTLFRCEAATPACLVGSFSVENKATAAQKLWSQSHAVQTVFLTPEIEAFLQTGPSFLAEPSLSVVQWQQDDLIYTVRLANGEQQQVLDLAQSMAKAAPIPSQTIIAQRPALAHAGGVCEVPGQFATPLETRTTALREDELQLIEPSPLRLRFRSSVITASELDAGISSQSSLLLANSLGLLAAPNLTPDLSLVVAASGGLLRFSDATVDGFEVLNFSLGLRQQLGEKTYGELGWSQNRFYRDGDFKTAENSLKLGIRRRDRLNRGLNLNSGYDLQARFVGSTASSDLSRFTNTLRVGVDYDLTEDLKVGADYRAVLDIFTDRSRTDLRHQLSGWAVYYIEPTIAISASVSYLAGPVVDLFDNTRDFNSIAFGLSVGLDIR